MIINIFFSSDKQSPAFYYSLSKEIGDGLANEKWKGAKQKMEQGFLHLDAESFPRKWEKKLGQRKNEREKQEDEC